MQMEFTGESVIAGADTTVGRYLEKLLASGQKPVCPTLFVCRWEPGFEAAADLSVRAVVLLSSHEVYSPEAGEGVDETRPAFTRSEAGRLSLRAEEELGAWCAARGIPFAAARAAWTLGKGTVGFMADLFDRVVAGRYVHLRGNDARISLVTALDVARAMVALAGMQGLYNVSDGRSHTWLELCEAMSANAGARKRMPHLPPKWAGCLSRAFGRLPIVADILDNERFEMMSQTLVLDNSRLVRATGLEFHDTLAVLAGTDSDYPYEDR